MNEYGVIAMLSIILVGVWADRILTTLDRIERQRR